MAEATVGDQTAQNNRFYCHQCSNEISPKLPEYICPTCSGGFIEEIQNEPERSGESENTDAATEISELWGRQFLQNFVPSANFNREHDGSGHSSSSVEDDEEMPGPNFPSFPAFIGRGGAGPRTHISVRRVTPGGTQMQIEGGNLHSVLEQLLFGLTGRASGAIMLGGPSGLTFGGLAGNPGDYVWGEGGLDAIITQLMNQLEGTGPPPASQDKIDNLQSITIDNRHTEKDAQCSVCFDDLTAGEEVKQLPCQHLYHRECIVPWLRQHGTCPVCRKTLDGTDTTCDENVQSIPETLQHMGINSEQQQNNTTPPSAVPSESSNRGSNPERSTTNNPSTTSTFQDLEPDQ